MLVLWKKKDKEELKNDHRFIKIIFERLYLIFLMPLIEIP